MVPKRSLVELSAAESSASDGSPLQFKWARRVAIAVAAAYGSPGTQSYWVALAF